MADTWTPARRERLTALIEEGHSAREIGDFMGMTKNMIISKARRLGLQLRGIGRPGAMQGASKNMALIRLAKAPVVKPAKIASAGLNFGTRRTFKARPLPQAPDEPGMVKLIELRACDCRWPVGDPRSDEFGFCGRKAVRGPYCVGHAARAFAAIQPKPARAA